MSASAPTAASSIPVWRSVFVVVLAGLTVAACLVGTPPAGVSETGVSLDLPGEVAGLWGTTQDVSEAERVILPPDTRFAKKMYSDGRGTDINCQIVLAGAEKRSIHRPEICLRGQGWELKSGQVMPIKMADGRSLDVMRLTIARPVTLSNGGQRELTAYYLYWFVGKDTITPHHLVRVLRTNLDMLLHNTNHRWAYVIVSAPVLEGLVPGGKSAPETLRILERFVSEIAPHIILNGRDTEG